MASMVKLTKTPVQKNRKNTKKKAQKISQYQLIDNWLNYAPRCTRDTKKSPNQIRPTETTSSSSGGLELILKNQGTYREDSKASTVFARFSPRDTVQRGMREN